MTIESYDRMVTRKEGVRLPKDTFHNLPEAKREKIIDVALREFETHAYQEASVNTIVKESGISKGSFYQYFEDKKDLYKMLMDRIVDEKMGYITEAMRNPMDHDFFEMIRDTYRMALLFVRDNPRYVRIGNRLLSDRSSPLYHEVVDENRDRALAVYKALIDNGVRRGELRSDIDAPLIAAMFYEMNIALTTYHLHYVKPDIDEKILDTVEELIRFIRRGIGKPIEGGNES